MSTPNTSAPSSNPRILPPYLWSTAYLTAHPDILAEATEMDRDRVAELFAAASQPTTPAPTTNNYSSRARIPDPNPYDGSVGDLYPFIDSLTNKLAVDSHLFDGEEAKVGYGYACLSPLAKERLAVEFVHLRDPSLTPKITNFTTFLSTLKRYFDDPGRKLKADQKITSIRQGSRPFTTFLADWDTTLAHSTYATASEATKISLLRNALCIELHQEFVGRTLPTAYEDLVDLCKSLDADLQQIASFRRNITPRNSTYTRPSLPRAESSNMSPPVATSLAQQTSQPIVTPADRRTVSQGGNLMDLDAASKEKGPDGRLTPNAKFARRSLNRCLRCNQPGHIANNCPLGQRLRVVEMLEAPVSAPEQLKE